MLFVMCGSSIFSSVLAIGERRAMGLNEVPIAVSLFGLGMGMIFPCFQMFGIVFVLSAMLYNWVR